MRILRPGKKSGALLLAVGALVVLTMFVVLPAVAFNTGDPEPPASGTYGITPTLVANGGQNNDCEVFYGVAGNGDGTYTVNGTTFHEFYVNNPKNTTTATDPTTGATFSFSIDTRTNVIKSWSSTGAAVTDVGVKGGTQTLRYNYNGAVPQPVTGDTSLHPPISGTDKQGNPLYYTVSHTGFCYTATAPVSGTAFTDSNGDGTQSGSTETGLSGLAVTVANSGGTTVGNGTTGSSGAYSITVPQGGPYSVCIQQPSSTRETVPTTSTTGNVTCTATGHAQYGYSATVGQSAVTGLNFGFQTVKSITVNAFIDNNGSGTNDNGDTAAVTGVQLFDGSGNAIGTQQQTSTNGQYVFSGLPVGTTYKVCVVTPTGGSYNETVPTSSTTNHASCPSGYASVGYSYSNLSADQTANFGFVPLKSITGSVFIDNNGNGSNDTGDAAASTTVKLLDATNNVLATQTTSSSGSYAFSNLPVGTTYKVCVVTPTGGSYNETVPTSSTTNHASCPSGYASVGYSYSSLSADQTANFGFVPLKSITVNAFIDNNGSGTNDNGDTAAVTGVQLFDGSGNAIGSQQTTTGGQYVFSGLPVGTTYKVCVVTPSGGSYNETVPTSGASCTSSYASVGYSYSNFSADQTATFGFEPVGSVSGTVYQDVNGPKAGGADGTFEATLDTPLAFWNVTLYDRSGNQVGLSVQSDANGQYSISAVFDSSQTYKVCVTPPVATGPWGQSEPLPTSDDNCSTPQLLKGQTFQPGSSGASVTENFGVDPAVAEPTPCPPPTPFGIDNTGTGGSELQIQLAACKPNQTFVFDSAPGPPDDPNGPWVSVWASDQTQPLVPLIEHIVFPDPITNGKPTFEHLLYTDAFPYDPLAAERMAFCQKDPRVPGPGDPNGLMTLPQGFTDQEFKTDVLPATNVGTQTPATTCLISLRTYVDANGKGWLEGYAASDIDGMTRGGN